MFSQDNRGNVYHCCRFSFFAYYSIDTMPSQPDARRSTSALLYDDRAEEKRAILEQRPLLGYTDISDSDKDQPFYRRINARYGGFETSGFRKIHLYLIFSCCYLDILWVSLFVYVTSEFVGGYCSDG